MDSTRSRRIARRLGTTVLVLLLALFLLWLALPRLLGIAAERWIDVSGLQELHVDIERISTTQAHLRELRATYESPGGQRYQLALHDLELSYSLTDRHIEQLRVSRGELAVAVATATEPSPWPHLEIPEIPLSDARIDRLNTSFRLPQGQTLKTEGSIHLWQKDEALQVEFTPNNAINARLHFSVFPSSAAEERLTLRAEWQPEDGPAAEAQLLIGTRPEEQAAKLVARASVPLLLDLAHRFEFAVPLSAVSGTLELTAEAQLGEQTGRVRSINGEATFSKIEGTLILAEVSEPQSFGASGKLKFAHQAAGTELQWQSGLVWQLVRAGSQSFQASGQLDKPLAVRIDAGSLSTEGELPFALLSPNWGRWSGALHGVNLQRANAQSPWKEANAQLRFKGLLRTWQHDALQLRDLQAFGETTINWSPSTGLRSTMKTQTTIGKLLRTGDTPLSIANSSWQLSAKAAARTDGDFWSNLSAEGEASSPQLRIEAATGWALTLGPTRIQVSPFRPAASTQKLEAEFSAKALRYGNWPSPDLNAHLRLERGKLSTDGGILFRGVEVLKFAGSHTVARACGEAKLALQQSLPALSKMLQPRPAVLTPLDLQAGSADASVFLDWCAEPNPHFGIRGFLHLRDATILWDKARAETVQATLTLDSLQPLKGRAQLSARRGELATGTDLADLSADIALTPHELSIQALDLKLLGGAVHSEPTRLPWPLGEQNLPLEIRQIDLGQLLALFKVEGLSGSGQLNGILPLAYRDGSLEIDNGQLSSPGAGTLKYAPTQAMPENPGLQALRNFHFQQLRTHIWYAASGAYRTQINLEGNNPDFYDGYPIRFGLNVNGGLPGIFRSAVFSGDFNRHILEQLQSGKLQ